MPQFALEVLKEYQKVTGRNSGFIFLTSKSTPISPRNLLRHYYNVLDRADVPRIRFHDLRHTAATILLKQNVHPKKVQELLGHSSIVLTLDTYSHIIQGMHDEAAEKMDELFRR